MRLKSAPLRGSKQKIFHAAIRLFRAKGFSATSMRDLAAACGMEASSIYNHYSSKEEVLQNILFERATEFFAQLDPILRMDLPAPMLLRMAVDRHVRVVTSDVDASMVFVQEWRHLTEPHLGHFISLRHQYRDYFIEILQKGIRTGSFRPINEKFAAVGLLSTLNALHEWYRPDGPLSISEIARQLSDQLLFGFMSTREDDLGPVLNTEEWNNSGNLESVNRNT
ncbi:MAG: TetR/AcrR family transcriptional regulator [Bacteroidia bacterium]